MGATTRADGVVEINYNACNADVFGYTPTGIPFNDAYRYVDWLLTVPLLLIEIVLVMKLSEAETFNRCVKLGVFSALMIANGYPGEVTGDPSTGKHGLTAGSIVAVQMGYTISDIISKCGVGYLVYRIGLAKSLVELEGGDKYSEVEVEQ